MKAKEIIKRIKENLSVEEVDAVQAFGTEATADFLRMRELNKGRSGGEAAFLRTLREFNQKWNVVFAELRTWKEFQRADGTSWVQDDDFVRVVLSISEKSDDLLQNQVDTLLRPQTVSNKQVWDAQRHAKQQEQTRKMLARIFFGASK